ncbi:MAG: CidA/LrgA family protein [Treponemataceae bacterium]
MKIFIQLGIFAFLCLLAQAISLLLPFAFPSSVIAMLILLILLIVRVIRIKQIEELSAFFKSNMAFFFLPSTVGIIEVFDLLKPIWIQFILICIISTIATFLATAGTVKIIMILQSKLAKD